MFAAAFLTMAAAFEHARSADPPEHVLLTRNEIARCPPPAPQRPPAV
jgi:hypothetical protein